MIRIGSMCILIGLAGLTATSAHARSHTERDAAEAALDALGPVTDQINHRKMRDTVTTFDGNNPPEADLSHQQFDQAISDVRTGGGMDGQAFQTTVDSVNLRPNVRLGSNPLRLADEAVQNAEDTVGGLFEADGGTCEALFEGGSYSGVRFCKAILQRDVRACELWREITVDREDFWACEMAERDYTRNCTGTVDWACTGSTGASCKRNRFTSNRSFTWHNSATQMRFAMTNTIGTEYLCFLNRKRIRIKAYAGFDVDELLIERFRFQGIGQIQVNGKVIWTYGTNVNGPLNIKYVEAAEGKEGLAPGTPVIHAGATPIDVCPLSSSPNRTASDISILSDVEIPRAGPSLIDANHRPYIPMDEHEDIIIDLYVANGATNTIDFRLNVDGSCCSQISPSGGEEC